MFSLTCIYGGGRVHYIGSTTISMSVSNRFFLSTTYTPSFITITYKSYNVNTLLITIKNNNHNPPPITHTPQTYFFNFEMITFYSSVIIIIAHLKNPLLILTIITMPYHYIPYIRTIMDRFFSIYSFPFVICLTIVVCKTSCRRQTSMALNI